MHPNINKILELYNEEPLDYINALPSSIESANVLMDMLKCLPTDVQLRTLITQAAYVVPRDILESTYKLEDRLELINLIWLSEEFGSGKIISYYRSEYNLNTVTANFNLNAHCMLLGCLILKITNEIHVTKKSVSDNILAIESAIIDCANNINKIDKHNLSKLAPLYYIISNIKTSITGSTCGTNKIVDALHSITKHLYGDKRDTVLDIATALDVWHDHNYWIACLDNHMQYDTEEYALPTL